MRTRFKWLMILMALAAFLAIGCGDDDENPTGPGSGGDPNVDMSAVQIDIPPAMSTAAGNGNLGATNAQAYLTQLNSFTIYSSWWTPVTKTARSHAAQDGGTWEWTVEGLTIRLETSNTGSVYTWKVWLNGNDGSESYDDFLFVDGYQEIGENSGNMSIYNPDAPGSAVMYWEWLTDPFGVFTNTLSMADEDFDLNAQSNPDGSGSLSQVVGSVATFEAAWAANGAGTYTFRDIEGQVIDSGTWPGQ